MNDAPQLHHMPKPPRTWLTLLMGGLLLISGMVMGAGGTIMFVKHRMEQPDSAPKHFSNRLAQRITRDLDLSDDQTQQVRAILQTHQKKMRSIRMEVNDEVDASFETLKTEVEAILSPEQAQIWNRRIREYRGRPPHERGGPGGGGGRGWPTSKTWSRHAGWVPRRRGL